MTTPKHPCVMATVNAVKEGIETMKGRLKGIVCFVLAWGVGSMAVAQPYLGRVPYEAIADLRSQPGESKQAFLRRIAPQFRAYAAKTGFMACGVIATDGHGGYGLVLGSNQSHLGCIGDRVPLGMTSTGETIHGPGKRGGFSMSPADKEIFAAMDDPHDEVDGLSPGSDTLVTMHGQVPDRFSDTDYAQPGYLVTPTGLLYQHGRHTEQPMVN